MRIVQSSIKSLLVCVGFALALSGCSKPDNSQTAQVADQSATQTATDDKMHVVTTFTIIADMAQNVAGDAALVDSITKAGAEIHDYEPTPQDITKIQTADLVLYNGLNLERWFDKFYTNAKEVPVAVVTEGIIPINITEGSYKDLPNPHAWMSPTNALIYIDNIKNAFVKNDPKNAETYQKNAKDYADKIKAMDAPLRAKLDAIPDDKRWLVTSEGAFSYLAKDYHLKEAYLWPINAEQQGSPKQVKQLIDTVKANNIPVVFSESTISDKPARQVAKETGAHYGGVLYVDSLSEAGGAVPTYMDLLNTTVSTIVQGFDDAKNSQQ